MTWFKIDDRMPDNAKVRKAGTAAMGLWSLAGAWSAGNLTDGFVPKEIAKRWDSGGKLAKKLVTSGLWSAAELDDEPGYQFHQWDEWQPSKSDVLARRRAAADRVAKHRARTAMTDEDVSNSASNALHEALVTDEVTPPPSRPVPTRPVPIKETPTASPAGPRFEEFWKAYPRRVGKVEARRKYDLIFKADPDMDPQILIDAATRYANDPNRADKFTRYPATWLHQGNWEDSESLFAENSNSQSGSRDVTGGW